MYEADPVYFEAIVGFPATKISGSADVVGGSQSTRSERGYPNVETFGQQALFESVLAKPTDELCRCRVSKGRLAAPQGKTESERKNVPGQR